MTQDKKAIAKDNKDQKNTKPEFKAKRYPRPWEMELTDEQRKNLRKAIIEDEKKYKEINKMMAKEGSSFDPFNKKK